MLFLSADTLILVISALISFTFVSLDGSSINFFTRLIVIRLIEGSVGMFPITGLSALRTILFGASTGYESLILVSTSSLLALRPRFFGRSTDSEIKLSSMLLDLRTLFFGESTDSEITLSSMILAF